MTRDVQIRLTAEGGFPNTFVTFTVPIYRRPVGLLTWTLWETLQIRRELDSTGSIQVIQDVPGIEGYETYAALPGPCAEDSYATPTGPIPVSINRLTNSVGVPLTGTQYNCLPYDVTFGLSFSSLNGTGCLIGFSEYESPSTPPKKYRTKTFTQPEQFRLCNSGPDCTNFNASGWHATYAGQNVYNRLTGALTIGATITNYANDNGCVIAGVHDITAVQNLGDGYLGSICHQPCIYINSQIEKMMLSGPPCNPSCYGCTSTSFYSPSGQAKEELSEPDTFWDALVRAGAPVGSGFSTSISSWDGGFCYTGQAVQHVTEFTNLRPGCQYTYRITYQIGSTTITEDYNFTADSTSETITDVVPIDVSHTVTPISAELFIT